MNHICQAVSFTSTTSWVLLKTAKEHPSQTKAWYKACPNVNQCRALKFLWPSPTFGKFTPSWIRTKVVTSHKPVFLSTACLLLSHTFKCRAGPFCTQLPQFDLLCVYALSFASLFPCPQPQSILCHLIWNAWEINIPFSQPGMRASGLQWHRRTTLHFSDWLWGVLWGDGVSLYLPSHPAPHQVQLGHGSQGSNLWQLWHCLLSIIQGSCWCSTAENSQTDRHSEHPASAPCSSQHLPQAPRFAPAWSSGALCVGAWVWIRSSTLGWGMQLWCAVTLWGLGFASREGGSAKVTTETWYPWILAILTYFWVFTHCWWQKRSKMEGLKLWEKKKGSFHHFLESRLFMIKFS